jgi:signal transduction histidine kinase
VQLEAAEDASSDGLLEEANDHLTRARELARSSLQEARRSVRALRPQVLEEKDLSAAMEDLITKTTAGTSLRAEFAVQGEPRPLAAHWDENLLRIGQEVLTNSLRHAQASEFKASVSFDANELRLTLRDNGRGFDPAGKFDGFGLLGMRERVEGMGGHLSIQSANGNGTTVSIILPYTANAQTLNA